MSTKQSNMRGYKQQLADRLYKIGAIQFGEFKVKHHTVNPHAPLSPFYINLRLVRSDYEAMRLVIRALHARTQRLSFDLLADIPTGITPVVAAWSYSKCIPMITPREPKGYGSNSTIDGIYTPGQRVLLVDDLITQGTSKFRPIELLAQSGLVVQDIVVLIDREQGGTNMLAIRGYQLHSVFTLHELFDYYRNQGFISPESYSIVQQYLQNEKIL